MREWLEDNKGIIIGLFILFTLYFCFRENDIPNDKISVKKAEVEAISKKRTEEKGSINKVLLEKELEIKKLSEKVKESQNKVVYLQNNLTKEKVKIKNMQYKQIADTLNKLFRTTNASAADKSIELKENLPHNVLESVVEGLVCKEVVVEKDKQLVFKDSIIENKDVQLKSSSVMLLSAEKEIEARKELEKQQEQLNKKLQRKEKMNKVLKPLYFIGGFAAGILIFK